jgi:hypothetical protein
MIKNSTTQKFFEKNGKIGFIGGLISGICDGSGNSIQYETIDKSLLILPIIYSAIKTGLKFKKDIYDEKGLENMLIDKEFKTLMSKGIISSAGLGAAATTYCVGLGYTAGYGVGYLLK